jgi:2,4-dienoyl-CoA reductase-like NADH-dependent reductase (Old Yellow Enzyme family)/thioredoxin reductase
LTHESYISKTIHKRSEKLIQKFEKLLSPGTIGTMKIRNRIVMPPMHSNYATHDDFVTKQGLDYYAARAKGGVGLIIFETTLVDPAGKHNPHQHGIYDDKFIPGLADVVEAVKEWGAKIAIQIYHAGRQASTEMSGLPVVAPSAIPCRVTQILPREMTTTECAELVESFAQAARRAKQAGFDAVEIHGAHGYIINQFLSPNTNRRTDKYGGDLNGRMTLLLEVVKRTRELVGQDYPLTVRLNADDLVEGGFVLEDCKQVSRKLETVGINGLHITLSTHEARLNPRIIRDATSMFEPRGVGVSYAEKIKKTVKLPIITVGSITPEMGEEILQQGKADFIAMGRGLLADPELPNKLMRGEPEDVRLCIRCQEHQTRGSESTRCTINAECGFESYPMMPPLRRKKVLIVGGGAAGMEAARVTALRGHDVTLYEKNTQLGGHLIEASVPDFKEDLRNYKDWLIGQIKKLGIKIELGKELTSQIVDDVKPDAMIVATGSTPCYPDIPGINKPIVTTAIDILLGKAKPGKKTIIVGGGDVGSETALYLAQQGNKVTIVEMLPEIASDVSGGIRRVLKRMLTDNGVKILTSTKVIEITDSGVTAIDHGQSVVNIEGDRVILALGLIPQAGLYHELRGKVREIYMIGDCVEPHRVAEATRDGYRVGSTI